MLKLVLSVCTVAWAVSALALPSASSASTSGASDSDSLAALFSAHGHWVDANDSSVTWTPSDAQSSTFRRQEHRWLPDALSSSSSSPRLVRLARTDILECLAGETVTIWGDSTARVLYYGLINKLEPTAVTDKHANRVLTFSPSPLPPHDHRTASSAPPRGNATFEFRWDPVLGSNSYSSFRPFLSTGRLPPLFSPSSSSPSSSSPTAAHPRPPALLLFSLGLWYIDPRPGMYPLARLAQYQADVRALLGLAARLRVARTALVVAEVERPVADKDDGGRWHPMGEVDEANEWLRGEVRRWSAQEGATARTRVVVGSVFNAMTANLSANTRDGLHYDLALAEEMADVVLHALCGPPGPGAGAHRGQGREGLCAACAARAGGAAALVAVLLGAGVWLCWTRELPNLDLVLRALARLRHRALGLWDRHGAPGPGYELVGGPAEAERAGGGARARGEREGGPCAREADEGPGTAG